jgi:glycine oxidase
MTTGADVLIIGGGVIGLSAAYHLARAGAGVEVIDRADFGQEASWAGAGILSPVSTGSSSDPVEQFRALSLSLFPKLSAELKEQTGIDNGYARTGGLELQVDDAILSSWRCNRVAFEQLTGHRLQEIEPVLSPSVGSAYFMPDMAQVRNPRHLQALLAVCRKFGVGLRPHCAFLGWGRQGARVSEARTTAGPKSAERFLIASGAWSDGLLGPLGWQPGIKPIRGQIVLLQPRRPILHRILLHGHRYLVPRADGRVLVGSTEEDVGFDKATTAGAIADLLTFALKLVPELQGASVERSWAGLRPGSPDGLPFIGPIPGFDNLFLAAGHFRAGIELSVATGKVCQELLMQHTPSSSLEPFRLNRLSTTPRVGVPTVA